MDSHSPVSEFDAFERSDVLEPLVQCIEQLTPMQKTILALYYHEDLELVEIAACLGLTECEIEQIRAETVGLLRTMLAGQIGLPEPPETGPPTRTLGSGVQTGSVGDEPVLLSH